MLSSPSSTRSYFTRTLDDDDDDDDKYVFDDDDDKFKNSTSHHQFYVLSPFELALLFTLFSSSTL